MAYRCEQTCVLLPCDRAARDKHIIETIYFRYHALKYVVVSHVLLRIHIAKYFHSAEFFLIHL